MIDYAYQPGNLVYFNGQSRAKIQEIKGQGNNISYELIVLKSFPNDSEKKALVKPTEIRPISLWGEGNEFLIRLGFKHRESDGVFVDTKNQIAIKKLSINFVEDVTKGINDFVLIGLKQISIYLIDNLSDIGLQEKSIIEKSKEVKNDEELKEFIVAYAKTSYVHDIQNFYTNRGLTFSEPMEKALLKFG